MGQNHLSLPLFLVNAASKGHLAIVQHLLNTANADPFCRNKFDELAYDAAAVAGEGYICKQLEAVERAKLEHQGNKQPSLLMR